MTGPGEPGLGFPGWSADSVLVDNSARVNSVTPAYIHKHNLGVHPISDLDHSLNP